MWLIKREKFTGPDSPLKVKISITNTEPTATFSMTALLYSNDLYQLKVQLSTPKQYQVLSLLLTDLYAQHLLASEPEASLLRFNNITASQLKTIMIQITDYLDKKLIDSDFHQVFSGAPASYVDPLQNTFFASTSKTDPVESADDQFAVATPK